MSARAMKGCMDVLKPVMKGENIKTLGTIVIGTVKGDLHDIGKNLVASMLEGCGFNVVNLGVDVSGEKFVNAVREHNAQIVCLSALLTTTMNYMADVVKIIEQEGLTDQIKVMIGGAPVNQEFADKIGADGYSSNANEAVALAKKLLNIC
jgi:methylmalonyl-CoA mutase cobalamin-binding domain/chain